METIETSKLKPHPKNNYFFDDIQGDNWEEFKKSIETSGVIEPIVINQDYMVVSGHQRVRACKELGIGDILCRIKIYDSDDVILKELLETNLRQRGIGNLNPIKFARCIVELERIYGVRQGSAKVIGDGKVFEENNSPQKSQDELASELGLEDSHLRNYKKLLTLIPELQGLIESGEMTPTVGHRVWAKLSQGDQQKLVNELGQEEIKNLTQKQTQEYIDKIKELEEKNIDYEEKLKIAMSKKVPNEDYLVLAQKNDKLLDQIQNERNDADSAKRELNIYKNKKPETVEIEVEVFPEDYKQTKEEKVKLENKVATLEEQLSGIQSKYNCDYFTRTCDSFLNELEFYNSSIKDLDYNETTIYIDYAAKVESFVKKFKNAVQKYVNKMNT